MGEQQNKRQSATRRGQSYNKRTMKIAAIFYVTSVALAKPAYNNEHGQQFLPGAIINMTAYKEAMAGIALMPGPHMLPPMDESGALLPGVPSPIIGGQTFLDGATLPQTFMSLKEGIHHQMPNMRQEKYPHGTTVEVAARDYENPVNNQCNPKEVLIQIQGVSGVTCVPECVNYLFCTYPTPPSMNNRTVSAQCALESPTGAAYCALICDPMGANGCPTGATCKYIQGTGICTYD